MPQAGLMSLLPVGHHKECSALSIDTQIILKFEFLRRYIFYAVMKHYRFWQEE